MRRLVIPCALLVFFSVALTGCNWYRRHFPKEPFRRIKAAVAYEIVRDDPTILIIDLRQPEEFQGDTGHLPHARNIPLARLPYVLREIAPYREETFLVYCRGGDSCGVEGARLLAASGFDDAILIDRGIDAWIRQGYKTVLTVQGAE
ncbi:MAG TPA: rhodanese-like domain-containing protein [Thermoanaerobaculia bacterium]|nr:rhodanese-like domain-containing protein [Thermoanaerobaculia bacterium]